LPFLCLFGWSVDSATREVLADQSSQFRPLKEQSFSVQLAADCPVKRIGYFSVQKASRLGQIGPIAIEYMLAM
jgi:hypothetical protein